MTEQKDLEEKVNQETPKPLFGKRPWRDTSLYSIDENGYYVSEVHPTAAKIMNYYLRAARWILRVEYKSEQKK